MEENVRQKQFGGDVWFDQQVDKRVRQSLEKQEVEFACEHEHDTNDQLLEYVREFAEELGRTPHADEIIGQLLAYLRRCAEELGRSPVKAEVEGGSYIAKRFVTWPLALQLAWLPLPQGMRPAKAAAIKEYQKLKKQRLAAEEENTPQYAVDIDDQ